MYRVLEQSHHRLNVFHLLSRSKRFHANCDVVFELDVTPLMNALQTAKSDGSPVGLVASLVKATGMALARFPKLNRHFYHGPLKPYFIEFDHVSCGLIVLRTAPDGEDILLLGEVPDADRKSVEEIHRQILHYHRAPLESLPEYQRLERLKRLPRFVRAAINAGMARSHRLHTRLIGATYGMSAFTGRSKAPVVSAGTFCPSACTFLPGTVRKRPWVEGDQIVVRDILPLSITADHFVLDGAELLPVFNYLAELFEDPALLGLPSVRPETRERVA